MNDAYIQLREDVEVQSRHVKALERELRTETGKLIRLERALGAETEKLKRGLRRGGVASQTTDAL